MADFTPIRAVFFDLDDTLCDRRKANKTCMPHVWQAMTPEAKNSTDFQEFAILLNLYTLPEQSRDARFSRVLREMGAFDEGHANELSGAYSSCMLEHLDLFEHAIQVLNELRKRYIVGIITNAQPQDQHEKIAKLGLNDLVDIVVIGGEVDLYKPDPRLFQHVANLAGVNPQESIYVGDNPQTDVTGANNADMVTVWANMHKAPMYSESCMPDFMITNLPELLTLPPIVNGKH